MILMGDSKSGKTGSLASLVCDGYKLRILDFDNGLDILKQCVLRDCPGKADNVEFRTLRDTKVSTPSGSIIKGTPRAFIDALRMLDRWKYDDVDLGVPGEWGPECILVMDSLTLCSAAAFDFRTHQTVQAAKGKVYDKRAIYKDAQDSIENLLDLLTGSAFQTNVIVIAHVKYVDVNPYQSDDEVSAVMKGYPRSVGSALGPLIPIYFNNIFRYKTVGSVRKIETEASAMFDLANAKPFTMPKEVPIATGLSTIFKELRDANPTTSKTIQPTSTPTQIRRKF
jgi:hypothetical protein